MSDGWANLYAYLCCGALPPLAWCPIQDIAWLNQHFGTGIGIAIAYVIFPACLWRVYKWSRIVGHWVQPRAWVLVSMGLFVASCGVGHVLREWTMFSGDFILEGRWMLLTFVCSMVADLGLWLHATDLKRLAKINGRRTDPHVPA